MKSKLLLLALGSNLGNRELYLKSAIDSLQGEVGNWLASSPIYETEPVGVEFYDPFLNQVVAFETNLDAFKILEITERLEKESGRKTKRDLKPRTLDIDILALGNVRLISDVLEIPHPRMVGREFVMRPLKEVVAGWKMGS